MVDEITQQGLLPGVKDPNLWMVKCKIGEEKATAIALMRKFIAYQFTDDPLQIKSVVCRRVCCFLFACLCMRLRLFPRV